MKVRLKKDFVLKAGGEFHTAPVRTRRYGPHYELIIGFGKDHCAFFEVDEELVKAYPDTFELIK